MLHLIESNGPKEDDIGFACPKSRPIAKRDFQPKELKLLPYTRDVKASQPESGRYAEIDATVNNSPVQRFYFLAPDFTAAAEGEAGVANPAAEIKHIVSPYWNAVLGRDSETAAPAGLQYQTQEFGVNLLVTPKASKSSQGTQWVGKGPAKVQLTVTYLSNMSTVKRGQTLKAASEAD